MRKVILSMMVSADGYIESVKPEEDWFVWDDDMAKYMLDFFQSIDTFIYGRKAYETMIQYWPLLSGGLADMMNSTPKLVFSKTLKDAVWNTTVIKDNPAAVIPGMKQQSGKNLALFAGADIAAEFMNHDLIDEYRLIVNPVILGGGKLLFKDVQIRKKLTLVEAKAFSCGNVILIYKPLKS